MKKEKNITILTWIGCVIISIAMIYVVLISACEFAIYSDMDIYQEEYEKYGVLENLDMEMDDVMYVTEEMMLFLYSKRADLVIDTVVGGEPREFFNESEISHMEDVRVLFAQGVFTRTVCIIMIIVLLLFIMKCNKRRWKEILSKAYIRTSIMLAVVVGIIGALFVIDFNKYFTIFHHIFFVGDTWIFDPRESLMINMLPEGLFYDMALRIVVVFFVFMFITLLVACVARILEKKKKINTTYK